MSPISPPGALPAYLQISESLSRDILSGRLQDGSKLAPERVMAKDLGIAVGTLRKALAALEDQGLIERIQGSGNYVRHSPNARTIYSLFRLERPAGGGLPTAEVLSVDTLPKPEGTPDFGPSTSAHRFRRLRFLDRYPVALEEIWLDGARVERIRTDDISESLYHFYDKRLGLRVGHCTDRVKIAQVPDWADPRFALTPGTPCGYIERITVDLGQQPFEFSRTWFDPDRAQYVARLK